MNPTLRILTPLLSVLAVCAFAPVPSTAAGPLTLARDGATEYVIVTAAEVSGVDRYAASELALYLGQMTGAEFSVIDAADLAAGAPALFVGLSAPALTRLGGTHPLADLGTQQVVYRSHGADLYFYGDGVHGSLRAVMAFLENKLGWRWYALFEHPVLPEHPEWTLTPFHVRRGMSYHYRSVDLQRSRDYPYQLGVNMNFDKHARHGAARTETELPLRDQRAFVSARPEIEGWTHSLHRYIPPAAPRRPFPWLDRDHYFKTHPEFFTLWSNQQRVPNRQLCFSNPDLRAEFTRNVLRQIAFEGEDNLVIEVGAEDSPGRLCYCEGCREMEARFESVGGPIYDYLIELCALLAEQHPTVSVKTFAYRRSQTQKPPTLPEGKRMPSNLIVEFAPIEDNYFADWTHSDPYIQETYADLQAWSAILAPGNLWSWIYPVPYGSGRLMPVSTVPRLIANLRLMHAAGVRGYYVDMGRMQHSRSSWSDLILYLIHRLGQDIDADTDAIIREFTDFMYGPAAPLIRAYLDELEAERQSMTDLSAQGYASTAGPGISYASRSYNANTFPYLTPEKIHRWQGLFEQMAVGLEAEGAQAHQRTNTQLARRELDHATLWKWAELQALAPEAYPDHAAIVDRIDAANRTQPLPAPEWENKAINRNWHTHPLSGYRPFVLLIENPGPPAPLPPPLDALPPESIVQFTADSAFRLPRWSFRGTLVEDPAAATGLSVRFNISGQPVTAGYYDEISRIQHGIDIAPEDVKTAGYALYRLGSAPLGEEGYFWFDRSWGLTFGEVRELYDPEHPDREWTFWASIRFEGPSYPGEGEPDEPDRLFVERIICVPVVAHEGAKAGPADAAAGGAEPEVDFAQPD